MQLSFSEGDYLKIGYEIGDRYFEEQGIFLGQEGDMLMLDVGDGETASIKDSKIVSIRRMKRSQEPPAEQTPAAPAPAPTAVELPAQSAAETPQPAAEQAQPATKQAPAAETPQPATEQPVAAETPQPTAEQEPAATLAAAQTAVAAAVQEQPAAHTPAPGTSVPAPASESVELLQEGYRYDFEREVRCMASLTEAERKQWLELFDRQEYRRLSKLVKESESAHSQEADGLRQMLRYLENTQTRYAKNTLINDGSWLYRGMIAIGVEHNVPRAYRFFMTSVKTETAHLKTAVYRSAVLYSIAGNQPRAVEVCKELIQYARKIEPAFDQCVCWKVMLEIFKNGEEWENYSECLFHLVEASYEHVRACINSIAKFTPELVRHGFYEDALELLALGVIRKLGFVDLLYLI